MNSIILIISIFPLLAFSQGLYKGVVNDENGEPIPYATIINTSKTSGTIANEIGYFEFNRVAKGDTLIVSSIGYETQTIPAKGDSPLTIILKQKTNEIEEVSINSGKIKEKRFGKFNKKKNLIVGWRKYSPGEETGLVIKNKDEIFLKSIRFYVPNNTFEQVKLRIRVRKIVDGKPGEDLSNKNILYTITSNGEQTIHVENFDIIINDDFYVGFELLSIQDDNQNDEREIIAISGKLFGEKCLFRASPAGEFEKTGPLSPAVELLVDKFTD